MSLSGRSIVVGMSGATGLAVVRALAQTGIDCLAVDSDPNVPGMATNCARAVVCPGWLEEPSAFLDFLASLGAGGEATLFACDDAALVVVDGGGGRLREAGLRPAWAARRPPAELLDKRVQLEAARAAGVAAPWTEWGDPDELAERAGSYEFPVVVKRAVSPVGTPALGRKVVFCDTPRKLRRALEVTRAFPVMVQESVPGRDDELYTAGIFACAAGHLAFTGRKLKQHPRSFGVARLAEAVDRPQLVGESVRLLAELGFEGLVQVEYKHDARSGDYKLMGVNLRPWTWLGLATACGVNLPAAAHAWALSGVAPVPQEQGEGRWVWLAAEARDTLRELRNGRRPDPAVWRGLRTEAFFARRDPAPFWRATARALGRSDALVGGGGRIPGDGAQAGADSDSRRMRLSRARSTVRRAAEWASWPLTAAAVYAEHRCEPQQPLVAGLPGERLLVLAPHPGDETIMCGAALVAARRRGAAVRVAFATAGEASPAGSARGGAAAARGGDALGQRPVGAAEVKRVDEAVVRRTEAEDAAEVLGVDDLVFWDLTGGGLHGEGSRLMELMTTELRAFVPTDLCLPFPWDVHPEHRALGLALAGALQAAGLVGAQGAEVHHRGGAASPTARPGAPAPGVHCAFIHTPYSPAWIDRLAPGGLDWGFRRRALGEYRTRGAACFARPQQLAWLQPVAWRRPCEAFVEFSAEDFVTFVRAVGETDAGGAGAPPPVRRHPLLYGYELAISRRQRRLISHLLAEARSAR